MQDGIDSLQSARGEQRRRRCTGKGAILSRERMAPLYPQENARGRPLTPPLAVCSLKSCGACRIGCLLFFAAIRFGLLLSSLPLCLRIGSLTQSPSTTDLRRPAGACRGGIAALAAVFTLFWDMVYRNLSIQLNNPHWSCRK